MGATGAKGEKGDEGAKGVEGKEGKEGKEGPAFGPATVSIVWRKEKLKLKPNTFTAIPFDTAEADPGKNVNLTTGAYVAPSTGYYAVAVEVTILAVSASAIYMTLSVSVGGNEKIRGGPLNTIPAGGSMGVETNGIVFCNSGEQIVVLALQKDAALEEERELQTAATGYLNRLQVVRVA